MKFFKNILNEIKYSTYSTSRLQLEGYTRISSKWTPFIRFISIIITLFFSYFILVLISDIYSYAKLNSIDQFYIVLYTIQILLCILIILAQKKILAIKNIYYSEQLKHLLIISPYTMERVANDRVVTNNLAYQNEKPKRFEVVTFYYPEDAKNPFLARIVGLPGETIEIVENTVFINDTKIPEPYIIIDQDLINQNIPNLNSLTDMPKTEIPELHYFVMGDNRINSYDSRLRGSVMGKDIFGKVEKIYWSDDMKRIDKNLNMYAE